MHTKYIQGVLFQITHFVRLHSRVLLPRSDQVRSRSSFHKYTFLDKLLFTFFSKNTPPKIPKTPIQKGIFKLVPFQKSLLKYIVPF
jgi:hypothetical protein